MSPLRGLAATLAAFALSLPVLASLAVTTTTLNGPTASDAGTTVVFTATVIGESPTGTVNFTDGPASIGGCAAAPLVAGEATCVTAFLTEGLHLLNAVYSGDAANGVSASNHLFHAVTGTITLPVRGDVNADRKADLFWREPSPGTGLSWWTMDGAAVLASNYFPVDAAWQVADVGDLDGDGKSDIVWRRASDGATYLWTLDGLGFKGFHDLGALDPSTWYFMGVADLDADSRADIVWRNADGTLYGWLMNGGTIVAQGVIGNPGEAWQVIDLADTNGDGKADLVFRHSTTGQVYAWFMNGLVPTGGASPGTIDMVWALLAAADFNGDGRADFLWRSIAGHHWLWIMDGSAITGGGSLGNPGGTWAVKSVADFDGDRKADIVWRDAAGTTYVWKMDGTTATAYLPIASPGGTWQIVGP